MRRISILTALAVCGLGLSQAATAQTRPADDPPRQCRQSDGKCERPDGARPRGPQPQGGQHDARRAPPPGAQGGQQRRAGHAPGQEQHGNQARRNAPRKGDSARQARPFQRADNSRFAAPGKGKDLRVMQGEVVLVDSRTGRVLDILGPVRNPR